MERDNDYNYPYYEKHRYDNFYTTEYNGYPTKKPGIYTNYPRISSSNSSGYSAKGNNGYPQKQPGVYPTKLPPKGKPVVVYGRNYPLPTDYSLH